MSARLMLLALALFAAASTLEVAVGQEFDFPLVNDFLSYQEHNSAMTVDTRAVIDARRSLITVKPCKKTGPYCKFSGTKPITKWKCYKKKCLDHSKFCGKPTRVCKTGQRCCGTKCKSILTDKKNCGKCGRVCPKPKKGETKCVKGVCNAY